MLAFHVYKELSKQIRFEGRGLEVSPSILNAARVLSPSVPAYQYPYFKGGFHEDTLHLSRGQYGNA